MLMSLNKLLVQLNLQKTTVMNHSKLRMHQNYNIRNGSRRTIYCLHIFKPKSNMKIIPIAMFSQMNNVPSFTKSSISRDKRQIEAKKIVYLALTGNLIITGAKFGLWVTTGSSAILSEAIHSIVDTGNQVFLLIGLRSAEERADKNYQYGYGKSVYFWSLVSALGTFWCGAGIAGWNSVLSLLNPSVQIEALGWEMWSVLGLSFAVDGWVFAKALRSLMKSKPPDVTLYQHWKSIRDPTTAAVLMEDGAACLGILIAISGIGATQITGLVLFDGIAGMLISGLLAHMGIYLSLLNHKYLIGYSVDPKITANIRKILLSRPSIEAVHSEQSQWVGPYRFSYKAEVEYDGTYLAAKLMRRYQHEFLSKKLDVDDIKVLLAWYAEDVMRTVEQEVRDAERQIRLQHPDAVYIELEPDSKLSEEYIEGHSPAYAIDDADRPSLRKIEINTINQLQRLFKENKPKPP